MAASCKEHGYFFYVIGDVPTPADFHLDGCEFFSLARQAATDLSFAAACPNRHYARKNIGYLLAMQAGAPLIVETDDDNLCREAFWSERHRIQRVTALADGGWTNVYRYFTEVNVWPRGLPLDAVQAKLTEFDELPVGDRDCPIQQGLADEDPDVDAIYRLVLPLPVNFRKDRRLALQSGSWCPFNSQNTAWWPDAYPLMYLPAYCSIRMTDIWRSLVAQRIAWANGWCVLFHEPTVYQERNQHNLMRDFEDEIAGYLNNRKIAERLESLSLPAGVDSLPGNLRLCYEALAGLGVIDRRELGLLEAWIADIASVRANGTEGSALRGAPERKIPVSEEAIDRSTHH